MGQDSTHRPAWPGPAKQRRRTSDALRRRDGAQFGVAGDRGWRGMRCGHGRDMLRDSTSAGRRVSIGSGAAGTTTARELDGAQDVLVVEAGGLKRDLSSERGVFHIEHLGPPYLNRQPPRARCFGGSDDRWFGRTRCSTDRLQGPYGSCTAAGRSHTTMWPWIERAATILACRNSTRSIPAARGQTSRSRRSRCRRRRTRRVLCRCADHGPSPPGADRAIRNVRCPSTRRSRL